MQSIINDEVEKMLKEGIIEPSNSPWSSPVVIVKKKDGKYRFCIDYRKINELSEKDAYPLPQITATLDKLRGARFLSTLDLKNGYWQVPLTHSSKQITAFTVPGIGLMQFRVMPFGLHTAPATFQRLLDTTLGPELEPHVLVYLDDIIIATRTFSEHLRILSKVFKKLRDARLKLNVEKCQFCRSELKYLGHIVNQKGLHTDPDKTKAVSAWPTPTTIRKVRQFLGMASWYRRFIPDFSKIAAPLNLLTKKNVRWKWSEEADTAFQKLKNALTSAPILACPDFSQKFVLQTDASTHGLGAVLTQNQEDGERVIAYASRTLNNAEKNYSATELECLAVVWGIQRMRDYLEGYHFTVLTDHQSLRWLKNIESPTGRLSRWKMQLAQYDCDIRYRKGTSNRVADALSREPETCVIQEKTQCSWYNRMWEKTQQRPDDIPDYTVKEEKLMRHLLHDLDFHETPTEAQWKECVPKELRKELINSYHADPAAGHLGVTKTIVRIARLYYWPGMFRDIAREVKNCSSCQAHKVAQARPAGMLRATSCKAPWEQVAVDLVGPLPRSTQGHTWLLTMQDRFGKWLEIQPLRQATASAITKSITEKVIYRHGCPDVLITDNGTQFKSGKLAETLASFGIKHRTTPAYTPQCNPVERTNRSIKTMIAQYVDRNHRRWDEYLAALQFAYNTAKHEATGFSPAYIEHGRELAGPRPAERGRGATADSPDENNRKLKDLRDLVRINLARGYQHQEKHYNLRRREWRPHVGEWVWKRDHPLSNKEKNFNAKLAPQYIGPLEIRKIISPVIFDLRDKNRRWHRQVHIRDLKKDLNQEAEEEENNADTHQE